MRHIIALDLDGVVANFHQIVLEVLNSVYGLHYTVADWNSWQFVCNVLWKTKDAPYRNESDARKAEKEVFRLAWNRWKEVPLQEPNAIRYANDLKRYGIVILFTGRQDLTDDINVALWCSAHGLKPHGFYCLDIDSGIGKSDFAPPFDIYIDDSPSTATRASARGATVYMPSRPWNVDVKASPLIKRIMSLSEVLEDLEAKKVG